MDCPNRRWTSPIRERETASRLSGEAARERHYVKSRSGGYGTPIRQPHLPGGWSPLGPVPEPGDYPGDNLPDDSPYRQLPEDFPERHKPQKIPFKPYRHPGGFGNRNPVYDPRGFPQRGGLTGRGLRLLRHPLFIVAGLALDFIPFGWQPQRYYDMRGWTLICRVPGLITALKWNTNNPNIACPIPSQVPQDWLNPLPTNIGWIGYGPFSAPRMTVTEQWGRPVPAPATLPHFGMNPPVGQDYQGSGFRPPPLPWPAIDPFALPPLIPTYPPRPIPYPALPERRPNPGRDPIEQPGGSQPSRPRPARPPRFRWRNDTQPSIDIPLVPGPPGGPPVVFPPGSGPRQSVHVRRKPMSGERERKKIMSLSESTPLGFIIGAIGEGADMLGVLWKSLPWEIRRGFKWKGSTILDRGAFILENLEHLRWGDVMANAVANQLEDSGFGKLGKLAAKGNQNLHRNFGIDLQGRMPKAYNIPGPRLTDEWLQAFDDYLASLM